MLIYKERKIANYNQKTIELRNEMYAVFNRIDNVRMQLEGAMMLGEKIIRNKNDIIYIYDKIKKHGNENLLREFYFSNISSRIQVMLGDNFTDLRKDMSDNAKNTKNTKNNKV
jgi:hypothetical protein